uniref:ZP domain-containing protein n=1 Tax=Sander lucioperca TaxID=283035 RepID=A0A8D0CQ78_SANLU
MLCFILCLAAVSTAATNQSFTSSGEINISLCPITYYGQIYDKVYVSNINALNSAFGLFQKHKQQDSVIFSNGMNCVVHKTNTKVRDPNVCSTVTCDVSGVASTASDCGAMERCQGDGRRRKDVSFLDRVILQLDRAGVQISLEQGGSVYLVVHGVALSRDKTGVTAKISASNYMVSVLVDGYTALIHMTGTEELKGQTDLKVVIQLWFILYPSPLPHIYNFHILIHMYTRVVPVGIVLLDNCIFLGAYARSCSQHSNITVESWSSKTGCPAVPLAFCQDRFCSAHEFCGENIGGKPRSMCRAIFASKYRSTSTFGEPTVCEQKSASVTLANCLLEEKNIDYSVLHLNDPACKAEMDNLTHMVTFHFDSSNTCGTVVMANSSQIIYKNTIMTQNISTFGLINRHSPVHIDFSCYYSQPDIQVVGVRYVAQELSPFHYQEKTDTYLRYDLIIKGCPNPADQTVKVEGNGLGMSNNFSFNTFQFYGQTGDVYLHCRLELCATQSNACAPVWPAWRRRRSALSKYKDENPAFISMAWTY